MANSSKRSFIGIDPEVYRLVKEVADRKGISVKTLIERALLTWARRTPEARRARASQR